MFQRGTKRLGGFVIYPTVVPDWRQFFSRDDLHVAAKEQLKVIQEAPADADPILAEQLVTAFTRSHNSEALTSLVRVMRQDMKINLETHHYHALLRTFNFDRDKPNMESVIGNLLNHHKATGTASQETYALLIDSLHTLSPLDVTERITQLVEIVFRYTNGQLLWCDPDAGCVGGRASAPVLTSLLHHVAHDRRYPAFLPIIVAAWIEAIGCVLTDWDYVNIISSLAAKADQFSVTRMVLGFVDDCPPGSFSLGALLERAHKYGMNGSHVDASSSAALARNPHLHILRLIETLHTSKMDAYWNVVKNSSVINLRVTSHKTLISRLLRHCVLNDRGVGPQLRNPLPVVHTAALIFSTLRNELDAVGVLPLALQLYKEHQAKYASVLEVSDVPHASPDSAGAEGASFHPHLLLDVGMVFDKCSDRCLAGLSSSYSEVAELVSNDATDAQVAGCGAFALMLMTTDEEVSAAWKHILASVDATATRVPHTVRSFVKRFVAFCSRHPPKKNYKMTPKGLAEREKWGRYIESRDQALVLFGSAPQAREAMRHLFYNNGQPQALRNSDMIEKDVADVCNTIFPQFSATGDWRTRRMSAAPLITVPKDEVPRHLWDPEVENPYPHCNLRCSPLDDAATQTQLTLDMFPVVWTALMSSETGIGAGKWFYRDPEMFLGLLRCLVYRLDWEAAVQLTMRSVQNFDFTFVMDQELQTMFNEIGDPFGSLLFKTATKVYDARIVVDSASKREHFHAKLGSAAAQEKVLREERTKQRMSGDLD